MLENKGKNLGAVGITKFKSRSFEAWQKSNMGYLFPVPPSTPLNERPYMQRPGGSVDGGDLKGKGLSGIAQARSYPKSEVDEKYEILEQEGSLVNFPFNRVGKAYSLPWNNNK